MNEKLDVEFISEEAVAHIVNDKEVTMISDEGIEEIFKIHRAMAFDGYLSLTDELKKYLGLEEKWIGIAWEFQGEYWHSLPEQMEHDRKKRNCI